MTNMPFIKSGLFWAVAIVSLVATGTVFAWELGFLSDFWVPPLPRFAPTVRDIVASVGIAALFSLNTGLIAWRMHYGSCPAGSKGAVSGAGILGALALLCPACTVIPLGIAGVSISLAFLSPFIPLLQIISLIVLSASLILLVRKL